ncbi:MAG: hypothetical protein IT446_15445 [Phycisphaerales bacterium]|nr:hypothetical protein [Phycisphaerales bacterium]
MCLRAMRILLPFLCLLAGCASPDVNPAQSTSHPANPDAPEAPYLVTPSTAPATTTFHPMEHEHHHP